MGGMLDALFEWTGLTGTQLFTSVVGGGVTYTPAAGFVGIDEFTYSIDDGNGGVDTGTVRVRVNSKPALTIGGAYAVGGFIPLLPYMLLKQALTALMVSSVLTVIALAAFGYVKGQFSGMRPVRSAIQTVLIGGLAAGAAFLIAKAIA